MSVYVYAITAATHPLRLDGVTGVGDPPQPLRIVKGTSLAAVISDAPDELRAKRRDVLAHVAALENLMEQGTVLPLRFGALAPDEETVRDTMEERTDAYQERLKAVEGCTEFHLKVSCDEEALLREVLRQSDDARRMNEEIRAGRGGQDLKVALGELVADEVRVRHETYASGIIEALRPSAREIQQSVASGDDFLSVSFLVEQERTEEFVARETGLAEQHGEDFDFRLRGPLPPYSFV
ncbi:GvpL/GvpF family gas vesicle protein [Streptomyces sp. ISL-10]|uniref:GvpL/GvpF family gas vesicle protein n=1 Tax=Streptomyces sp. ISL-10 TaxID=2819172 RepID=UPI001BE7BD65|nr:GvpL/GvpF family gas vesicle protein [Streptomyces sp. ISL-10]MBT2365657.1 GvpL/GvpF family gas vesicle protein [Streptomyces sp. ISL-10]